MPSPNRPETEPKVLFRNEWVPNSGRRRLTGALLGATAGGLLGLAGYPWIAGNRRDELAAWLEKEWKNSSPEPQGRSRREQDTFASTRPVVLDANGRAYETFLSKLELRHIKPIELLRPHFKSRGTINNELPSPALWPNMVATLRVADELREKLGVPLVAIASAYRSPAYNASCPGAAVHSCHLQNLALDLVFGCPSERVVEAASTLRDQGFFRGGIGTYPSFTHIDTRGQNVNWG